MPEFEKEKELNAQLTKEIYILRTENDKLRNQISILEQTFHKKVRNKSMDLER